MDTFKDQGQCRTLKKSKEDYLDDLMIKYKIKRDNNIGFLFTLFNCHYFKRNNIINEGNYYFKLEKYYRIYHKQFGVSYEN